MLYILYLTAFGGFSVPHRTKPIYFPPADWPPEASLTCPQRLCCCQFQSVQHSKAFVELISALQERNLRQGRQQTQTSGNCQHGTLGRDEGGTQEWKESYLEMRRKAKDWKAGLLTPIIICVCHSILSQLMTEKSISPFDFHVYHYGLHERQVFGEEGMIREIKSGRDKTHNWNEQFHWFAFIFCKIRLFTFLLCWLTT